jgi:hypothetical protein
MAALGKTLHKFAKSAAQDSAGTGTAEAPAQLAQQAADTTLPGTSLRTLPGTSGRTLPDAAKHFGDLVPVLIARDREQPEEGRHRWEFAAHCIATAPAAYHISSTLPTTLQHIENLEFLF